MNKAIFSLEDYRFEKVWIDFTRKQSDEIEIGFRPTGKFHSDSAIFILNFSFIAHNGDINNPFIKVDCLATYRFQEKINFQDIPPYFYQNSIAILFPYIRAFVSTVTLQANIGPILLPTMNLSELESPLRDNTSEIN